ncbi:MAG: PolC-type DNA polymerase III [Erysipelotrichaceae bacterium]|nr:PolC-type DNA polymerase III [Erysipelotrichaceae bacterium]
MDCTQLAVRLGMSDEALVYFSGGRIRSVLLDKDKSHLFLSLSLKKVLPFGIWQQFVNRIDQELHVSLELQIETEDLDFSLKDLQDYCDYFIRSQKFDSLSEMLVQSGREGYVFLFADDERFAAGEDEVVKLKELLSDCGMTQSIRADILSEMPPEVVVLPVEESTPAVSPQTAKNDYYRKRKGQQETITPLDQILSPIPDVTVCGEVFKVEYRKSRNDNYSQNLYLFDGSGALVARRWTREEATFGQWQTQIKEGDWISARGKVEVDNMRGDLVLQLRSYQPAENRFEREDEAEITRVELHAHTNRSEMDGVCDTAKLVKRAYSLGLSGIAITDHQVVQAFPAAYQAYKEIKKKDPESDFKLLYGVEVNMIEDLMQIATGDLSLPLPEDFVVFDLETTGLSNWSDFIIEFGGVRYQHGMEVKRLQLLINPNQALRPQITDLTGISDEMLSSAPTWGEVKNQIKEFVQGSILVGHNLKFDLGFLQANFVGENFLEDVTTIDTLSLSRALHPERSHHKLGNTARFYNIKYEDDAAHRAVYDAEVTGNVYLNLIREAKSRGVQTLQELQDMQSLDSIKRMDRKHVVLLAKDGQGLFDLFTLISLSHTRYLALVNNKSSKDKSDEVATEPRLPKSEIEKVREHLLVGSACVNGELFELASNRSREELQEAMAFYDYVEIQPPANYSFLIDRGTIASEEALRAILSRLIEVAKEAGKPVCVTGDVHYLEPQDKIFRDVYINAMGIGGVRHPLYVYREELRRTTKAPDQHLRTTGEMFEAFEWLPSELLKEIIIDNPRLVANACEELHPVKDKLYTPSLQEADENLRKITIENAIALYGDPLPLLIAERLEKELNAILSNGFGVIYYIAYLLVKRSNELGYLVGSRGSVGSSLVATMMHITEVNPLPPYYLCPKCHKLDFVDSVASGYDLPDIACPHCGATMKGEGQNIPFETFLGFNGDKVPDIDLNFSGDMQDKAHDFVRDLFGHDHVFRAGTIGTVADKTAYGYVSGYCEAMGIEGMSQALRTYLAAGCTDVKRTTGQHPGGIIVIPKEMDVHDFTPIQYPANNPDSDWYTTHFDFKTIHDNVLKLDLLGHVDPTAMKMMEKLSGLDVRELPQNDPAVLQVFYSTESLDIDARSYPEKNGAIGLPEFGTANTRRILDKTMPRHFSDLVRISGLSHGTDVWANNAEKLIDAGHKLSEIICCRDDIMVTLKEYGLADKDAFDIMESVRKGRGLKPQWEALINEHQLPEWYSESCNRIQYMFPKAHAVAYVMMAVRVAWFKVYQPVVYYATFFSLRCSNYEIETMVKGLGAIRNRYNQISSRLADINTKSQVTDKEIAILATLEAALEMHLRGYRFSNIDLYQSAATQFLPDPKDPKAILPSFSCLDGLGAKVANSIVEARQENEFISIQDLKNRTLLSDKLVQKLQAMGILEGLQAQNQLSLF